MVTQFHFQLSSGARASLSVLRVTSECQSFHYMIHGAGDYHKKNGRRM